MQRTFCTIYKIKYDSNLKTVITQVNVHSVIKTDTFIVVQMYRFRYCVQEPLTMSVLLIIWTFIPVKCDLYSCEMLRSAD